MRVVAGKGEPGMDETRRMSSDIGTDFLDANVYERFAAAKPRAGVDLAAGAGVLGSAFSFGRN